MQHNPRAGPPSTETLKAVFLELEAYRITRTAMLVKKARAQGEIRVVEGVEACKRRNDVVRGMYSVPEGATPEMVKEGIREVYKDILDFPFSPGESEI